MGEAPNTLFLRLEGPLQAWGDPSKFVIRRTMDAPTKSGVIGLICCAMGRSRQGVVQNPVPDDELRALAQSLITKGETERDELRLALLDLLNTLQMGVRIDRPGMRWWDWHTVGAKYGILNAKGEVKKTASTGEYETLITRREYLADASFLVALQGNSVLIERIVARMGNPEWPLYLGRKSCPPSMPILCKPYAGEEAKWANPMAFSDDVKAALTLVPWHPRYASDETPATGELPCLIEWRKTDESPIAPVSAEVWYDAPYSFDPSVHHPRLVLRDSVAVQISGDALQQHVPSPSRPRADYGKSEWTSKRLVEVVNEQTGEVALEPFGARPRRLRRDHDLCVFCKQPASTVQHVTYRHAGGDEQLDELRSLCRLCHDAVTMIEYGLGMGLDRINPEEPSWRDRIIAKRDEIVAFRSMETRRRRFAKEEVE